MTTFKGNRRYPNPVTVTEDPRSHTLALQQIIEALNTGQRRTRDIQNSFVRLHELVDVGLIEIVNGQLKLTNLGNVIASGGATALSGLTDVDLTGLADGDTLVWNSGTSNWEPQPASGGASALADLTDVDLTGLADGQLLVWNASLSVWEPQTVSGAGPITGADMYDVSLSDLSDCSIYLPRHRDVLTYDATTRMWYPEDPRPVTPDTYPVSPTAWDDEFDGTSLDSKWVRNTSLSGGTPTINLTGGALIMTTLGNLVYCYGQAISGAFKVRAKIGMRSHSAPNSFAPSQQAGLYVANGSKRISWHILSSTAMEIGRWTNTSFNTANTYSSGLHIDTIIAGRVYIEIEFDGTSTLYYRLSKSGHEGTFYSLASESTASHLGGAPVEVGLMALRSSGTNIDLICDWFRRIS